MYGMKIKKTFRLSERAVEILDGQENATQFVEEAILYKRPLEKTPPWKNIEYKLDLIEKYISSPTANVESATTPKTEIELPDCCTALKKCQHWSYSELDENWVHRLTGETKEAE